MLSHHYILRKSVVFIVDTEYCGASYQSKANSYLMRNFKALNGQDYFGYINLGKHARGEKFILEKKENNTFLKEKTIKMI